MKAIADDVWIGKNIFITGGAGVGKSSLIAELKKQGLNFLFLAPTGLIAANGVVKGKTLHSFFRIPFKIDRDTGVLPLGEYNMNMLNSVDAIVIDEVSMVRSDVFKYIDLSLQANCRNEKPFGGKQIILVGDVFQLPPVVAHGAEKQALEDSFGGRYFFQTDSFKNGGFSCHELTKVFRQKDEVFVEILNDIKRGKINYSNLKKLNTRNISNDDDKGIIITPTNRSVDKYNASMLSMESGKELSFKASVEGDFDFSKSRFRETLLLKKGCKVMMITNNYEEGFTNGDIGKLVSVDEETGILTVKRESDGKLCKIRKGEDVTEVLTYDRKEKKILSKVVGRCYQYPLVLAYCISVHKSQGMTFSSVVFDKGAGVFDFGQLYVALSRCRTLDTLFLPKPISEEDIFVDDNIVEFYETQINKS